MSTLTTFPRPFPAQDVNRVLHRDIASLLITSELISSSLLALRPECAFSAELTPVLDSMIQLCDSAEMRLRTALGSTGNALDRVADASAGTLITGFFSRLPDSDDREVFVTEVRLNLQLLTQHVELKAQLAADEALLAGNYALNQTLSAWAKEWRTWGQTLRSAIMRARAQAYVARHPELAWARSA